MKILLAEDEEQLSRVLVAAMKSVNYDVDAVFNGRDAVELAKKNSYDVIILDIMMPIMDGITALKQIRKSGDKTYVLMLTAKAEIDDRVTGLDSGADDYLTKPFSYNELNGRVKALLRRYHVYQGKGTTQEKQITYKTGNIEVNSAKRTASIDGEKLNLTDLEYNILEYLLMNKQQVISPSQLFEAIWHEEYYYGANNTIMVHIRHLRQKIEKDTTNPEHIKTIWGKGYYCE